MRLPVILPLLLFFVLPYTVNAQEAEWYALFKKNFVAKAHANTSEFERAFYNSAMQTFNIDNDTAFRLLQRYRQAHKEVDDSSAIALLTRSVITHFIDEDMMGYVCPANYDRAERVLAAYSHYFCDCVTAQKPVVDSTDQMTEAMSSCRRSLRENDSLRKYFSEIGNESGIAITSLGYCQTAYFYRQCLYVREHAVELCTRIALAQYRHYKFVILTSFAKMFQYYMRYDKLYISKGLFVNEAVYNQMIRAAASADLTVSATEVLTHYAEVLNYGHALVITFMVNATTKPILLAQFKLTLDWNEAAFIITSVDLKMGRYIQDRERILSGVRKLYEEYQSKQK